jgi:phosphatidylglycerophosphate synthase
LTEWGDTYIFRISLAYLLSNIEKEERMYLKTKDQVFLYPCTLIGYSRLLLLSGAVTWPLLTSPDLPAMRFGVASLIGLSLLLDLLDGYLARKLSQTTQFGVLLDQAIDLISHTFVWAISGFYLAQLLIILEWTAGLYVVAFSFKPGGHWKKVFTQTGPAWLRFYFSRNQRNFLSGYSNLGHFIFPISLYLYHGPVWVSYVALPGLVIYEAATLWMFWILLNHLASPDRD